MEKKKARTMNARLWFVLSLLLSLALVLPAQVLAREHPRPSRIYAVETTGEIRSIDLPNQEAIIGGFRYYFSSQGSKPSRVSILGYEAGALELLQVGMKVRVQFADTGVSRYVLKLQQLRSSTEVGS
jgi:hypothetical protein